jgi:RNA polymerase sigma factor (sigma-70 family)
MSQIETPLADLLVRLRTGDAAAAAEVVRRYETAIRVAVRSRLTDPAVRRQLDSVDVCQSVLASFFIRMSAGQFDLEKPEDLVGLLVRMAQNKLVSQVRFHNRERRDIRRVEADGADRLERLAAGSDPERIAAGRELLAAVLAELTEDERDIADHRGAGRTWPEIAVEMGGTPEARRKQLERALDRVTVRLGIDEEESDG